MAWKIYIEVFKLAINKDIPIIDITSKFLEIKNYSNLLCDDGIHPNEKGHKIIAEAIKEYIEKRKIGLIAAGLITLSGVSIIEEIYVYGNEKNKSNIQLEEYEIKDLANLIGKNKIDVENVLGKGYEKEILQQESNVYIGFDEKREVASLINISFVEDDESTYRIISERLWNELGKSSLKFVSSDNKVIETWNKGDLEINFNKIKDCISIKIN